MNIDYLLQQAIVFHQQGGLKDAEALYLQILQIQAAHPDANHNLGVLAVQMLQPEKGLTHFKAAIDANPKQGQYWLSYVEALLQANQPDTARTILEQGRQIGLNGTAVDALAARIESLFLTIEPVPLPTQKTIKSTQKNKTASQKKKSTVQHATPSQQEIDALVALFNNQHYTEVLEQAMAMTVSFPKLAFGWKVLGAVLKQLGRNTEALGPMEKAAALSPSDAEAQNNLGVTLSALGQQTDAVHSYHRAIQINPDFAEAHNNFGAALKEQGLLAEAEASYHRAIQIKPDYFEAHNNLGNLHNIQGLFARAESSFRTAISINPRFAEGHKNLGAVLKELERFDDAEIYQRRAIQIKPDFADAYNHLGLTQKEMQRLEEAEASFRKAIQIQPEFAEAKINLGLILRDDGRLSEAEVCFREAIKISPEMAEAYNCLGIVLTNTGRRDAARIAFEKAWQLKPDSAAPLVGLGNILCDSGHFVEAEKLYHQASDLEPDRSEAWAQLPKCRKMTDADQAWLKRAEEFVLRNLSKVAESQLCFAMGKFCDDTKRYDESFQYFHRANELKKKLARPHDRTNDTIVTQQLAAAYSHANVNQRRKGASASDRPLFIVGMPRSGTSLTEQIIASHPAAFGAGELRFWSNVGKQFKREVLMADFDEPFLTNVAADCLLDLANYSTEALRVVDKMPGNVKFVGLIHAVFPNARILHTRRNPIDTCLSIYFQDFNAGHSYSNDLDDLAHYYREYHNRMMHWHSVLPPGVLLDVPYESLVEDQESWSRKIIDFIGLEWDDKCLSFHQTERKVGTASNWQVRQPIYKGSKERWRNYEKFVAPLLPLLGLYDPLID